MGLQRFLLYPAIKLLSTLCYAKQVELGHEVKEAFLTIIGCSLFSEPKGLDICRTFESFYESVSVNKHEYII